MIAETQNQTTTYGAGIHYFDGRVACPLAGVGNRGSHASNRVAIDDDTSSVVVDRTAQRITVTHRERTSRKTIIADLMFLADGHARGGRVIPFGLHLKIFKTGDKISLDFHRHMRTQDELVDADFEPFEVIVTDGDASETVLDPAKVLAMVRRPGWVHRVIKSLMATRNHLDGVAQDPDAVGFRLADLSMGFGRKRLAWIMTRAKLVSLSADNGPLIRDGSLTQMLVDGSWRLELAAFTDKYLPEVIKRDLFLYGLAESELLAEVRAHGLAPGQTLAFRFERGEGAVELGARSEPLDNAIDVARAYLEFHMLGGLLVEETERRIAG